MRIEHPEVPFSIESDVVSSRYVKRHHDGSMEAATSVEYLLLLLLAKLDGGTIENQEVIDGRILSTNSPKRVAEDVAPTHETPTNEEAKTSQESQESSEDDDTEEDTEEVPPPPKGTLPAELKKAKTSKRAE